MSTMQTAGQKRKRPSPSRPKHPYLAGNFAPIRQTLPLTPCTYTGAIPPELAGGEYVRNGSNPVSDNELGRDAHWFDGDGMLAGVSFTASSTMRADGTTASEIVPEFVNQYVLTDIYLSTISSRRLRRPILPSIATLVNPLSSLLTVCLLVFRTIFLVLLSHLPGSRQKIKKISVANTSLLYHDGRALATCESGPPMRIQLPGLETVGWYDGVSAEGESEGPGKDASSQKVDAEEKLGGPGLLGWIREWTTAHPKVDPTTKEMMLFHSSFAPPYVQYSVVSASKTPSCATTSASAALPNIINKSVPGVTSAKMMHDFGVSGQHTVIMDLPLSLDPLNLVKNKPVVAYDGEGRSRFGVFPRRDPQAVRWFETSACCIFHTANTWDEYGAAGKVTAVNMLACRLTSASIVFAAGNIAAPAPTKKTVRRVQRSSVSGQRNRRMSFFKRYDMNVDASVGGTDRAANEGTRRRGDADAWEKLPELESPSLETEPLLLHCSPSSGSDASASTQRGNAASQHVDDDADAVEDDADAEEDQCRLYYYRFDLSSPPSENSITAQWALTAIPFEFPSVRPDVEMQAARYIYGCTMTGSNFGAALGRATKIDALAKIDVKALIERGRAKPPRGVTGVVDDRTVQQIVRDNATAEHDDAIKIFTAPSGWYLQEPRFVPRRPPPVQPHPHHQHADAREEDVEDEDAGYLLSYAFDESQLLPSGEVAAGAVSELWIIDARSMRHVLCRIALPQRVPYGLHGTWFSSEEVAGQRGVRGFRRVGDRREDRVEGRGVWAGIRRRVEGWVG
ncbi:hypothetical protein LTR50_005600 [Elasticomyces elasticus]|nr:hypothetical protein LTR50_005600 [Elasticomyces elasticus]